MIDLSLVLKHLVGASLNDTTVIACLRAYLCAFIKVCVTKNLSTSSCYVTPARCKLSHAQPQRSFRARSRKEFHVSFNQ